MSLWSDHSLSEELMDFTPGTGGVRVKDGIPLTFMLSPITF